MILARMFTCGWRRSRLRTYASSDGSADGTSVMLTLFVIVSAVTAPRTGQVRLCTPGVGWIAAAGAPGACVIELLDPPPSALEQVRVSRSLTIGWTELACA